MNILALDKELGPIALTTFLCVGWMFVRWGMVVDFPLYLFMRRVLALRAGNANAYNFYFYSAIVVNIASDVANSTSAVQAVT
jgi:hypothetical protein